ncbi:hypothetical protein TRVA0_050S00254 [Trichomonascus vanleenenianus]|uniref:uncharacterized protein n=1 Tax=Trichomonascus vanleenenianus TaxID=2268995 RepID=UPI003EC97BEB
MRLVISYRNHKRDLEVRDDLVMGELHQMIESETSVPCEMQKLIAPKAGVVTFGDSDRLVKEVFSEFQRERIMLVGTPVEKIQELQKAEMAKAVEESKLAKRRAYMAKYARRPARTTPTKSLKYSFGRLSVLPLPNADKSMAVLERIRDDKGVQAIMEKYKLSVGLLTELDPATNTTHQSRLLGLNRNKGEAIELRLRTDDYQGWCSYKEIIKVLCHELSHNYYGEHDRQFWDFTNKLEREVLDLDPFGRSGKRIGTEIYNPESSTAATSFTLGEGNANELDVDEGGWYGSTEILGGDRSEGSLRSNIRKAAESRRNN